VSGMATQQPRKPKSVEELEKELKKIADCIEKARKGQPC